MLEDVEKAPTCSSPRGIKRDSKFTPKKPAVEIEAKKSLNKEEILSEFNQINKNLLKSASFAG
jgi:hypothetical protein